MANPADRFGLYWRNRETHLRSNISRIRHVQLGKTVPNAIQASSHTNLVVQIATTQKTVFFVSVGLVKMSITLFNMRLTGLTSRKWMMAHWTFFAILVVYTLTALFINVFQCKPPQAHWDLIYAGKLPDPPTCLTATFVSSLLSTWHVVMDFCLLTVPIIVLWKLQIKWSTKIRLYIVFSVGSMSCVGSVVRQIYQGRLHSDLSCPWVSVLQARKRH